MTDERDNAEQTAEGFQQDAASRQEAMLSQPLPAARSDLQISPQLYLGRTVYVVKDPVSLNYYRIQPAERWVLGQLDGTPNAKDLAEQATRRFPDQPTSPQDVARFIQMLQGAGLLLGRSDSHGQWLRRTRDERRWRKTRARLLNFLFIRIPLIDPDRVLDKLYGYAGLAMNRVTMWLAIAFMVVSAGAGLLELHRVRDLAMPLLSWQNLLLLGATFIGVKIIHEFGHGLAAKHRGLEVHEMGVLLMVFFPLLYVDVSDAWMVPRRRDRMWITAGGVFIEFLFASVAVWVWLNTRPGVVNQIAFNTMLAASVTTLLFNANPLLRYDGYYFLMDWLQIPNLRAKASQYLGYLAKRYVLAMPEQRPPREASTHPVFMPLYAVAANVYRWLIVFGIIGLVWHILDPYGLQAVGALLGMAAIVTMVLLPLAKMVRFLWVQQAKTWRRALATVGGAAGLALVAWGILSIPMEQTVEQPAVVLAARRQPVFVARAGRVDQVLAEPGEKLAKDEPILKLEDPDLRDKLDQLRVQRQLAELNLTTARQRGKPEGVRAALTQTEQLGRRIEHVEREIAKLTIRAPIAGRLQSKRRLAGMVGAHVERGRRIGRVIGRGERTIAMVVPQSDASIVEPGMEARVRLWGSAGATHEATVRRIGSHFLRSLPHPALSSRYAGEVETKRSSRNRTRPAKPSVVTRLGLPSDAPPLRDGMTGRGKVVVGRSSLGWQQWRSIRKAMSLDWWL